MAHQSARHSAAAVLHLQPTESDSKRKVRRRTAGQERQRGDRMTRRAGCAWPKVSGGSEQATNANGHHADCRKQAGRDCQGGHAKLRVVGEPRRRIPSVECLQHRRKQRRKQQHHQNAPNQGSAHVEILQDEEAVHRHDEVAVSLDSARLQSAANFRCAASNSSS